MYYFIDVLDKIRIHYSNNEENLVYIQKILNYLLENE